MNNLRVNGAFRLHRCVSIDVCWCYSFTTTLCTVNIYVWVATQKTSVSPYNTRLKKINPMSQSCRAHLFFLARLIQQNSRFEFFFCLLNFFIHFFYELACRNIQEEIWQTKWNTLNNRLLRFCVLSCILFIQNQVPYFKAVTDSNLTRMLLRKKTHLGQVFQSVTSFET